MPAAPDEAQESSLEAASDPTSGSQGRVRRALARMGFDLPRAYWIVWSGLLVNRIGGMVRTFLIVYLTQARDLSVAEAGVVLTGMGLGGLVGTQVGGFLADRWGRRKTLALMLISAGVFLGMLGTVRTYELLLIAAVFTGLTLDTFRPASQALMVDIVGIERRQQAFGLNFWAVNLGFAIAGILGSALVSHGFWLLFLVDALSGVIFAAIVWFGIPADPPRAHSKVRDSAERPAGLMTALRDPIIVGLAITLVIEGLVYQQSIYVYPLAMIADGMRAADYGAVAFCNGVVIVLLQPWWTRIVDRFSPMPTMAWGMVVLGIGFFLTTWANTKLDYVLVCIVWTCGEILRAGLVGAVVANIAPASARARYQSAVMGLGYGTAALLAPLVGTRVFSAFGGDAVWLLCLGLNLIGALWLVTVVQRQYRERLRHLDSTDSDDENDFSAAKVQTSSFPHKPQLSQPRSPDSAPDSKSGAL